MDHVQILFLEALHAALKGRQVDWTSLTTEEYTALMQLAGTQFVLPMVYEAVYSCPAVRALPPQITLPYRQQTMYQVAIQAQKTADFLALYRALAGQGLNPMVVKGLSCRVLYPNPDSRASADEDLLIDPAEFRTYHAALLGCGFSTDRPEDQLEQGHDTPYRSQEDPLFMIELHRYLFEPDAEAFGGLNDYFTDAKDRSTTIELSGVTLRTMGHNDHLFYLVLHAYKHFLHSGFGLRQLCDICMFATHYGSQLDWVQFSVNLHSLNLYRFVSALFTIGRQYLGFDPEAACMPEGWISDHIDTDHLLQDLLGAGVFGNSSMSRKHSANMTLDAVAAEKTGTKQRGIMKSLFPSAKELSHRYHYLEKQPWLLPFAWADRIVKYGMETASADADNSAAESLRIGRERIELLREYGIID